MWIFLGMIVVFITIVKFPNIIGLDTNVGMILTNMWPGLFLSCIAIYMYFKADKNGKFGGLMFMGLCFCILLGQANTQGLLTTEILHGLTVIQLQAWVLGVSIIAGAFSYSKR